MNKNFKIFMLVILNLIFLESQVIKSNDKYIKFNFTYEYPVVDKFTRNSIDFLKEISDSSGPGIFTLLQIRQKNNHFIKIPNNFIQYIKNDTLNILIMSSIWFNSDSIPKPDLPDSISYFFQGIMKVRSIFINDSSVVNIKWNFNDLEIQPLWHGDY